MLLIEILDNSCITLKLVIMPFTKKNFIRIGGHLSFVFAPVFIASKFKGIFWLAGCIRDLDFSQNDDEGHPLFYTSLDS